MKKVLSVILVVAIILLMTPSVEAVSGHYDAIYAIEKKMAWHYKEYQKDPSLLEWIDFGNSYIKEMFTDADAITIFLEVTLPGDEIKANNNYRFYVSWFWKEFAAIGAEYTDSEVWMFVVYGDEQIYLASKFGVLDVAGHKMYDNIKD